jgi:histidine triad (HIT) family protein
LSEDGCAFCGIVTGRTPSHVVWSDAEHVAILDAKPIAAGHVLLVSRAHVVWMEDLSSDAYARLFVRVRALLGPVAAAAAAPHAGIAVEGYGVAHVHVHVVPI